MAGSLDGSVCVWELSSGVERCRTNLCLEPERIEGVTKVLRVCCYVCAVYALVWLAKAASVSACV